MAAKRSRTGGTSDASMVSNAAEAVGKALGTAVSALESAVGTRRKGANGYQKMKARGHGGDCRGSAGGQPEPQDGLGFEFEDAGPKPLDPEPGA